jgi:hypothetical protein
MNTIYRDDPRNELNVDLVRFIYSMIKNMDKTNLLSAEGQVKTIVGQEREGEKERTREKG